MITRRKIVIAVGAGTLTPTAAFAQLRRTRIPRIGVLIGGTPATFAERVDAMREGLRELGYVEDKTIAVEYRFAEGQYERLTGFAAEFVKSGVDALVTFGTPATRFAQRATKTIPIIMVGTGDPIASGFIRSLARPGGNITGTTNISPEIGAKRLDLLAAVVPGLARVGVLLNADNPTRDTNFRSVLAAARTMGLQAVRVEVRTAPDIERAFETMKQSRVDAFVAQRDQFLLQQHRKIVELAMAARLPAIYADVKFVRDGGLMSYGASDHQVYHRPAAYIDKILKGIKPGDIPVEQPMIFELVFNKKAAAGLNVTVPDSILLRADIVIE